MVMISGRELLEVVCLASGDLQSTPHLHFLQKVT